VILVDTSVWIDHFRRSDERLMALLGDGTVLAHPFVIGEIALGHLRSREAALQELHDLPPAAVAGREEVLHLIEQRRLFGSDLAYVDVHLIASARLMAGTTLWTRDKRLHAAAEMLNLAYDPRV
jgi:predicted nucleic acid-binding protein